MLLFSLRQIFSNKDILIAFIFLFKYSDSEFEVEMAWVVDMYVILIANTSQILYFNMKFTCTITVKTV